MKQQPTVAALPAVSLAGLVAGEPESLASLRRAASEWGIFYLEDVEIPSSMVENLIDASNRFFALSAEEKAKSSLNDRSDFRGYVGPGEELTNGKPDLKESYEFAQDGACPPEDSSRPYASLYGLNPWPEDALASGFREAVQAYMSRIENISGRMAAALVDSLEIDPASRDSQWSAPLHYRTRLIHYTRIDDLADGVLRVHEHTDLALFNLLRINAPGLEARNADGTWIEVAPREDALVVILGEFADWWTNGRYRAGVHRVRQVAIEGVRTSMPFFFYPNLQTDWKCLDGERMSAAGVGSTAGEILYRRLAGVHPEPPPAATSPTETISAAT